MVATSLFSLALLLLAGVLADAHRRDWRQARDAEDPTPDALRFARRRFARRSVATTTIGLVGVMIAVWPLTPREPFWVVGYAATLTSMALLILTLGVFDAVASGRRHRDEARRQLAEHVAALRLALESEAADEQPS